MLDAAGDLGRAVAIIHGDDDQLNPIAKTGRRTAQAIRGAELEVYEGGPHGLIITDKERFTQDVLAFIRGEPRGRS